MASNSYDPHSSFPPRIGDSVLGHTSNGNGFNGHNNANSWVGGDNSTAGHHAHGPGTGGSVVDAGPQDRFLKQAEGLEITREDRQEGYDPDLIHSLQPRTGQADAAAQAAAQRDSGGLTLPRASSELKDPIVPASSKPYESRAVGGKVRTSTGTGYGAGRKSDGERKTSGGRSSRRHKKKKLPFYKEKKFFVIAGVLLLLLIGLGAGLGAGLGIKKSSKAATSSNDSLPAGVTVSQTSPAGARPTTTGGDVARTTPTIVPSMIAAQGIDSSATGRRTARWT